MVIEIRQDHHSIFLHSLLAKGAADYLYLFVPVQNKPFFKVFESKSDK